ncbi:LL-diaminopimelate aminotransferase [Evansella tamaricis]|uniref:LL-diaminopimelate aminotransferase n=1 Tax=Evansella tamaricis TaxID=2069301 RepID=A0ABS6JHA6_9BACI|nr:LL-diaminopimelate aminotransferase [Evansella tamaricis]MBU9713056.1 LL-diaminopimelate aminotransferase [Evansella tamaricis]
MEIRLSNKMNQFQTSIFNELSYYKKQKLESGMEIIDLSIGSPDLGPPEHVIEELSNQVKDAGQYGYSLTGTGEFYDAVSDYYGKNYGVLIDARKEVLMTMGSQDGLVHFPMILTNPEDVILVPDPGYTAYSAGISLAGAKPYSMPLKEENQFLPDLRQIPEEVCKKAKLMILNFPGNPVPALATTKFFEEVVRFAEKYHITVLHDFAYSELYYEDKPISFLSIDGAKEVGIEFNSLSKSYNMAGCRIGYVVGNPTIIEAFNRFKSNLDYGVFLPIQRAAVTALQHSSVFSEKLRGVYRKRRDILVEGLNGAGWKVDAPDASMFIWAKVPEGFNSTSFAYQLIDETGVVVTPGNAFGETGEGFVRIALVQDNEVLKKAVQKLNDCDLFNS